MLSDSGLRLSEQMGNEEELEWGTFDDKFCSYLEVTRGCGCCRDYKRLWLLQLRLWSIDEAYAVDFDIDRCCGCVCGQCCVCGQYCVCGQCYIGMIHVHITYPTAFNVGRILHRVATLRNIAKDLLRTLMIKSLIERFYSALQIILLMFLIQVGCCWRLQKFTISCIASADKHWTNHAMITQQSPLTHLQRPYVYTGKSVGHNTGIRFGFTASWKPKRSKLVCFRLLAMMLLQSVNSGRQDRRKSLERAQQARSLARLFALKAAILLHCPLSFICPLFFNRGRGHR